MAKPFVTVKIVENSGVYSASVDEDPYSRAWSELAKWKIQGANLLPSGSVVYLQFVDKANGKAPIEGPLYDGKKKGGKYNSQAAGNTIFIESVVSGANGGYHYQIGYELNNQPNLLLDPEIVVEGNAPLIKKFLRACVADWQESLRQRLGEPRAKKAKKAKKARKAAKRPAGKKR